MRDDIWVEPTALSYAFEKIEDGNAFERFAKQFAAIVLGPDFQAAGGLHDRGIDGFEHSFLSETPELTVYQISIRQDVENKVRESVLTLKKNEISVKRFFYITNRLVRDKEALISKLFEEFKLPCYIWDLEWFRSQVNLSRRTATCYYTFVDSYLHEFSAPGKSIIASDFTDDPRLFVFLRQLWDEHRHNLPLNELLADCLILYSLEGTDPNGRIMLSRVEILEQIAKHVKIYPQLQEAIDNRLGTLSKKPRRINHHKREDKYVLPYATRVDIQNRNLRDAAIYEEFIELTSQKLLEYLDDSSIGASDCLRLIESVLHKIYSQQGLEFANFVLHGEAAEAVEKSLPDAVSEVVDAAGVKANPVRVKAALLMCIRDVVYNGSPGQVEFLRSLSRTYVLLFLVRKDPKVAGFFDAMTGELTIYVDTSILIPALSEHFLDDRNQRYSNLLRAAHNAGAELVVNETIVDELAGHFRMIKKTFHDYYEGREEAYAGEEEILYIPEIMIRAFFYARLREHVRSFDDFLEAYASKSLVTVKEDLIAWLRDDFGIEFRSNDSVKVAIDGEELGRLEAELSEHKNSQEQARTDARLVLTIYALRAADNEAGGSGVFGYKTWWLSTDTMTAKAVKKVFGGKYGTSVYMRPDFLYNFVSLMPTKAEAETSFKTYFPSLVGVSISYHMAEAVSTLVRTFVREHEHIPALRVRASLRALADGLKSDASYRDAKFVKHYLDEERERIASGVVAGQPG